MDLEELELEVDRKRAALDEARKVYDRTNIESRDSRLVRRAEDLLTVAEGHLRRAHEAVARTDAKEQAEQQRLKLREPPSLQQLVLAYGTYDRITPEAWRKFDADMAEWKYKIREGKFDAKIW